ncbi:MAG: aminotransferase class I/II-fold pyridoxal phosphate-dependent enzyme [Actinobacteria bacterium]|nr:aminotransferase class I/II-fold pyridoxal phosphate-dependent enzyme [Actinomycetota bacterium]MBU1944155.1 aminotransferase class I/II-fold pyridoxal phosphate-dependent enzyme [Actinomycetota bacterium]MBU2687474.1 aminotransferase class I/II-fold pyridoxal phosphate-dependent enzyme [Actinomycetota bacterium]
MRVKPFELERFFARHEFTAPYTLTSSDCEPLALAEALSLADDEMRAAWDGMRLGYSETAGSSLLREEVAGLYQGIDRSLVQIAAPEECIFLAMNAMLGAGDHVVATFPGYQSLYELAGAIGCEVDRWEPDESEGWRFDPDELDRLARPDTRAIIVNFPHNPTGHHPTREEFEAIVDIAGDRGAWLFSDEMYRYLELDSGTLPAACELYERGVSLSGLSKTFGLPGARIGWLATRDAGLRERVLLLREYTTICSSPLSEVLAVIAIRARDTIISANISRLRRNLDILDGYFAEREGLFGWVRPRAGTVAFPRLRFGTSARSFCEELLSETGVLLVPSPVFLYGDSHFRLGFGRENMPEVLEMVKGFLDGRTTA